MKAEDPFEGTRGTGFAGPQGALPGGGWV